MCWKYGPGLQLWLLRERETHLSVISLLSLFQKKNCFERMKSCRNSRLGPLSPYISETLVHRQVGQRQEMDTDFIGGYKIQYYLFSQFQIMIQNTGFNIFGMFRKAKPSKGGCLCSPSAGVFCRVHRASPRLSAVLLPSPVHLLRQTCFNSQSSSFCHVSEIKEN